MATGKRQKFLENLRSGGKSSKKTVNVKLEAMLDKMMEDAVRDDSAMSFEEKIQVGKLAIQLESVRNRLESDDYGTGFGVPSEVESPLDTTEE